MSISFDSFKTPGLFYIRYKTENEIFIYVNQSKFPGGYNISIISSSSRNVSLNKPDVVFISKGSWNDAYSNKVENVTRNKNLTRKFITWIF